MSIRPTHRGVHFWTDAVFAWALPSTGNSYSTTPTPSIASVGVGLTIHPTHWGVLLCTEAAHRRSRLGWSRWTATSWARLITNTVSTCPTYPACRWCPQSTPATTPSPPPCDTPSSSQERSLHSKSGCHTRKTSPPDLCRMTESQVFPWGRRSFLKWG